MPRAIVSPALVYENNVNRDISVSTVAKLRTVPSTSYG